jgi:hypothetical protein
MTKKEAQAVLPVLPFCCGKAGKERLLWALARLCLLTLRGNSAYHDFACVITFSGRG